MLRQFEGRSGLSTYITVVVQRLFVDRRNQLWAQMAALGRGASTGPTAGLLDQLVPREGCSCKQALDRARQALPPVDRCSRRRCRAGSSPGRTREGNVAAEAMKRDVGGCPDLETIAAYLDRQLATRERNALTEHLSSCETCYFVFSEATQIKKPDVLRWWRRTPLGRGREA